MGNSVDDNNEVEHYEDGRTEWKIWSEDITSNEAYLAQKAFNTGTHEECKKWGNHLLKILKHKAGMAHHYTPSGSNRSVDV